MMEAFVKLQLGLLVVIYLAQFASSCSCVQSHPQENLCYHRSFAALVKVRSADFVYITERPRTRRNQTGNTTDRMTSQNTAGLNKRGVVSGENKDMERVEVVVKEKDLYKLSLTNFVVSYMRYRVKVYETYKGLKTEDVNGKKVYIYTAPYGSLCGVTLQEKATYLLIGTVSDDRKLNIGLCSYHQVHWNVLDSKQKRVIRRNMRAATDTCKSACSVRYCDPDWMSCEKNEDTCLWTSQMDRTNYKLNIDPTAYVCKRELGKQDASCKWTGGLSESKRGRRRRRRNHASGLKRRPKHSPANP